MNKIIKLVKTYPFSVCFVLLYAILWIMLFLIPYRHPAGDIASGEGLVISIFIGYIIATISLITTISLAIFRREYIFYGYLSSFILLPILIVIVLTYF